MKNFKLLFLILCLGLLSPAGMTSLYAQTCNNPLDIHVANDISGSVNSTEYLQSKDFVIQLGLSLPLGTSATESRIGISQWSSGSTRFVEYIFPTAGATYTTAPSDIIAYVNSARPFSGGTDPYTALQKAYNWVLQDPVGGRTATPVIVLLTDASCRQIANNLSALATQIKANGVTIVVMAVEAASSCTALQGTNVASPGAYFSAANYNILQANALSYISSLIGGVCPPNPPSPVVDLSVDINTFEITNCSTTPTTALNYTVSNTGLQAFSGTLEVSFYNGDPTLPGAQYLFTESSNQSIAATNGTYNGSTSNVALLNNANVYAVVNIDGSLAANATPISPNFTGITLTDAAETNTVNNISTAFARTNGIGCIPFADLNVQVSNNGIACDDQVTYTVEVCNNGSGDAVMSESDITAFAPAGYTLLDFTAVGNSPFTQSGCAAGTFSGFTSTTISADHQIGDLVVGDFDGDGDLDIASGRDNVAAEFVLWSNNGSGVFTKTIISADGQLGDMVVGDFDGDGDLDIASARDNIFSRFVLWLNNGSGVFTKTLISIVPQEGKLVVGDFDNDGDLDIASAEDADNSEFMLWSNNGSGMFTETIISLDRQRQDMVVGDFDGDGDLDIASGNDSDGDEFTLWSNNGIGVFSKTTISIVLQQGELVVGDFDNDGDLDIASGRDDVLNEFVLWSNNGSGVFTKTIISADQQVTDLEVGDFDGDGDLDIASGRDNNNDEFVLWSNNGSGVFSKTIISANRQVTDLEVADFDGDGDLDIASGRDNAISEFVLWSNNCIQQDRLLANTCATYQYTYDVSGAGSGTFDFSVGLTATADAGDDPVQYGPNTNFTANGNPNLNGFNGAANSSDDLTRSGVAAACPSGDLITASMVLTPATCPGEFSTATLTITNQTGVELNNLELALDLTGTDAVFNGEPYNLSTGLRLAEANVLDPAYPAVPNAISETTGSQSLAIFNLPNGSSTVDIDIVLGTTQTDLELAVQQIPTSYNASGDVSTTAGLTPGTVPTISGTPPADVTIAATTLTLNYSTTGANSVEWTSGSNGSFANAAAATTTYTINDLDRANGYVDLNLQAISADVCDASEGFRVNITGATFDYGDAPLSYDFGETLLPTAAAATINPNVYLGSTPPGSENASTPTADATGDGIEEDGLNTAVIPDVKPGQTYTLTVTATNNDTTRPAYLRAFIDWNTDGDFLGDEGEVSQEVIVPANSGNSSYPVEFSVPANVSSNLSDVIVRLRLSTDEFAAARTFGASANGEVEDFQIQPNVCLPLNLKVYLAGALIDNGGATGSNNEPLMRDNLRSSAITGQIGNNVIPALEPYTALAGFTHVGSGGGRSATAAAFDDRGQNSVVDWVFIEFRDKNDNTSVLETMSALVQRDGDVVDIDGVSPIQLCTTESEYYVAVRHRNHLGVMTALAEDLKLDNTVDFTDNNVGGSGVFNYGTSHPVGGLAGFDYTGLSQQSAFNFAPLPGGVNALWAGNSSGDDKIKFESPDDDLNTMLFSVLLFPGNSSFQPSFDFALTYDVGDLDMNGKVKFESPDDDQNFLLFQVLLHPLNNTFQSSFDFIFEQLP